ncbi:hypothetical protein ACWKWZ_17280, partial [Metapseudomonas otitidis]|uniref:hypothetical protein n=1 Tax=Metapseudomonas otitidis TaxID=319939 RepID=UPI002E7CD471|nr:hypothetical protein [Pseudomonas otitidis]
AHSTAAFLSVKLFFEEFFLSTQQLALRSISLPKRGAHSTAPLSSVKLFFEIFFSTQQLSSLGRAFRFSEARILHE